MVTTRAVMSAGTTRRNLWFGVVAIWERLSWWLVSAESVAAFAWGNPPGGVAHHVKYSAGSARPRVAYAAAGVAATSCASPPFAIWLSPRPGRRPPRSRGRAGRQPFRRRPALAAAAHCTYAAARW